MSEENETIRDGKVVSIEYVLRNEAGEELDKSEPGHPLEYLHGARNIVVGLEKKLEGLAVGAEVTVTVPPSEGYGQRDRGKAWQVPRSSFPAGTPLERGMQFGTQDAKGRRVPVWITKVQGPTITVDPNHPLAGVTLVFSVKVVGIREATEEEKAHGHAHGPHGHGHGH